MNEPAIVGEVQISHPVIAVLDAILFHALSSHYKELKIYRDRGSIRIVADGKNCDAPPHQMAAPFMFAVQTYAYLTHERQLSVSFRFEVQTAHCWKIFFTSENTNRQAIEQQLNDIARTADKIMWLADPQQ